VKKPANRPQAKKSIDWEQIKSRLLNENVGEYTEEDLEAIFAQRADALARAALQHQHKRASTHLGCKLGTISLLLPLAHVLRIMSAQRTARVPGAPSLLGQLMHVDGKLVAIADLRAELDLPSAPFEKRIVVLLGEGPRRLALAVDGLSGLVSLAEGSISPATTHAGVGADFVAGLSPDLALVIDTHRLIHGLKAAADPSTSSKGATI
jgi:chemotaxis signal transduction protein